MTNAVTNAAGATAVSTAGRASRLAGLKQHAEANALPMHRYLSHSGKTNMYSFKDSQGSLVTVPTGTEFVLNVDEMGHSWVCWKDGKPVDAINVSIIAGGELPVQEELPDHGPYTVKQNQSPDGWSRQYTFPMKGVKDGIEYVYKTGSPSSYRAMSRFISALIMEGGQLEDKLPVISIQTGSYVAGNGNKVEHPVFKIARWVDIAGTSFTFKLMQDAAANTTGATQDAPGGGGAKGLTDRRDATDADVA
jgi:hypothetical protein